MTAKLEQVVVHEDDWDGPQPGTFPWDGGWVIVNAPRPLAGPQTWTGQFRHGVFYAAGPTEGADGERLAKLWKSDDAWPVIFTDDGAVEAAVLAKFAEYGYADETDAGVTIAEQAESMGLPYRGTR